MVRDLKLRPRARRDLSDIYAYTEKNWSPEQAERYIAAIRAEFSLIRAKPDLGRAVRGAQAPFCRRASGSHVIFYLVDDDRIDVVRVLHQSMDFTAHLANDET